MLHSREDRADSYEAWFNLGLAYQKTGRMDQAGNAYREAAKLRPQAPEANAHLGVLLQERGDLAGARRACEAALAAAPDSPGLLWNLALLAEREGRAEEAEQHFTKLVGLKPDWEDAAYRLGFCSSSVAITPPPWIASRSHKQRGTVEALLNLGLACWKFQDLDTAAQTFERILSLQPENPDALRALIAIAIERKDQNRAWDLHQKLVAMGQASVELSYNLGLLLQSVGEQEKAAQCFQLAADAKPDCRAALTNLGHALKASGKDEEAQRLHCAAIEVGAETGREVFQ